MPNPRQFGGRASFPIPLPLESATVNNPSPGRSLQPSREPRYPRHAQHHHIRVHRSLFYMLDLFTNYHNKCNGFTGGILALSYSKVHDVLEWYTR